MTNIQLTQRDRDAANKAFDIAFQGDTATIDDDMAELFARHRLERSEPVGWQRRYKFALASDPAGKVYQWEACSAQEATGHFERQAGYEYRPLYTTPPEPVAEIERLRGVLAYIAAEAASSVSSYGEMDVHAFERIEKVAAQALGDKA